MSPEPVARPRTIFSHIRRPTYFTTAISNSLLMGATGKQRDGTWVENGTTTRIGRPVNNHLINPTDCINVSWNVFHLLVNRFSLQGDNLRKKSSRIEDENESLMMQLKKMATRSRSNPEFQVFLYPLFARSPT